MLLLIIPFCSANSPICDIFETMERRIVAIFRKILVAILVACVRDGQFLLILKSLKLRFKFPPLFVQNIQLQSWLKHFVCVNLPSETESHRQNESHAARKILWPSMHSPRLFIQGQLQKKNIRVYKISKMYTVTAKTLTLTLLTGHELVICFILTTFRIYQMAILSKSS